MKYKVGDKVKIKSLDWYNANKTEGGEVYLESMVFLQLMSKYCGKVATITTHAFRYGYYLDIDGGCYHWTDEMFEENINNMETKEIIIPQGWEIDKVKGNKIILKESKKELPKTWKKCCELLGKGEFIDIESDIVNIDNIISADSSFKYTLPIGLGKPVLALMQLLVCREVYRQGWKPDWTNGDENKYCIINDIDKIAKITCLFNSKVLSFQSKEIRNKFLENFKDLIEEAKELI